MRGGGLLLAALAGAGYLYYLATHKGPTIDLRYEAQPVIDPGYMSADRVDAFAASKGLKPGDYRLEVWYGGSRSERVVIRDVRAMNAHGVPVTQGARSFAELNAQRSGTVPLAKQLWDATMKQAMGPSEDEIHAFMKN